MRRVLLLAATVAIPVSALSVGVVAGGQAWAKAPKLNGKIVCSSISGTETTTVTVSGCVDSGSATASSSTVPAATSSLATGGTVSWTSGGSVTFAQPTISGPSAKHCPGYVKGASSEPTADKFSGTITSDTAGLKLPGKFKGEVCISTSGNITDLKPLETT